MRKEERVEEAAELQGHLGVGVLSSAHSSSEWELLLLHTPQAVLGKSILN